MFESVNAYFEGKKRDSLKLIIPDMDGFSVALLDLEFLERRMLEI